MTDALGPDCKLVWAQDAQGEIGRRPALERGLFEISAETFVSLQQHVKLLYGRRAGR